METTILKISQIVPNSGQIEGLPKNPRFIKDERFEALKKSILDDPEMLELREVIVYPHNGKYVAIGGNMRFRAGKALGFKEMPCKVLPVDTPLEKLKRYAEKDNISFGNWDFDALANEWDTEFLEDCGFDFGTFYDSEAESEEQPTTAKPKKKDTEEDDEDDFDEDKGKGMGEIKGVQDLVKMKDPAMYRETKDAISRYHSVMGVRQTKVKLADLPANTHGVHATLNGESEGIYLNKKYFNSGRKKVMESARKGYESGWSTKTNKPLAHTVTHELAHATWNNHLKGANQKAAGIEIRKMYGTWLKDKKKKGYGEYATTNVNEFWAETVTKAVHGNADKYTRKAKAIVKKYKL